jgi:hypothetical protein
VITLLLFGCGPAGVVIGDPPAVGDDTAAPDDRSPGDSGPTDTTPEQLGDAPGDTSPEDIDDVLFEEGRINALALELDSDAVYELRRDGRDYVPAELVYEGRAWSVAIRIKGSSTWTDFYDKPSLVVDVNRLVPDQEFMGHKRFNLHNQLIDPSMMSEVMSYRYLRDAGLPASRAGYVRLTVNGEDYGLYTAVEAINDDFLETWFADPDGNMYENGWQDCDLDDFQCFEPEEVDEGNDDALRALVEDAQLQGDAWETAMRERFDWTLFIRSLAMDALIAHWDGYAYDRSNYHLYHDPTADKWTFIPQSMDLDYGWRPWSYDTCGRYGVDPGDYTEGILGRKCLESDTCRAEFVAELLRLNDAFEEADPVGRIDTLYALIADEVATDRHKHYSTNDFEDHVDCVREWVAQRPDEIRAWAAGE